MEGISPNPVLNGEDTEVLQDVNIFKKCPEEALHRVTLEVFRHRDAKVGFNCIEASFLKLDCCCPKNLAFWLGFAAKHQAIQGGNTLSTEVLKGANLRNIWLAQWHLFMKKIQEVKPRLAH